MARHLRFVARTVMVKDENVEAACGQLLGLLTREKVVAAVKGKRYFEKPCRERQRKNFENCRRIYHSEMGRRIAFLAKADREDPWIGR